MAMKTLKTVRTAQPEEPDLDSSTPPRETTAPSSTLFEVVTLGQLGANLPMGIVVAGQRVRPFRLRPFKLKQEKAIAKLRDDAKGSTFGKFVCQVMSMMVQTLGPHNFDTMKEHEKMLAVNQLDMPDVIYLYLYLRYEALRNEPVKMHIRCPACSNEYDWYGDMGTIDVKKVRDDDLDLVTIYKLQDAIEIRSKTISELKLAPIKWGMFSRPGFDQKNSQGALLIQSSIVGAVGIDGPTFMMGDNELDELTKFDMSGITSHIEDHTPGAQLDIDPKCPACNYQSRMMLDWSWEHFFARSAQPTPSTT